jgi:hypothetical protein
MRCHSLSQATTHFRPRSCLLVCHSSQVKVTLRRTVSRSVGQPVLVSYPFWGPMTRFLLLSNNCSLVDMGHPLWREDGSVICCGYTHPCMSSIFKILLVALAAILLRQSQSYVTTGGLPPISSSWSQAPWDPRPVFFSTYVTSSLTRGWVCRSQLLLVLASAVILGSEYRGTHDHILLSQIRDSPNLEGHVPVFISSRNRMAQLYPQALGSLLVASYNSQLYGGGIRTRLHAGFLRHTIFVVPM